jgi:O-antigen ligase
MMAFDREKLARSADVLAVLLAISLPWSTSATGILVALWLIVFVPTLSGEPIRRVLATPAGGLPVLLWLIGAMGMAWAFDVPLSERLAGLSSFHKLLVIPLLIAQFQRSSRGAWVLNGFLVSSTILLVMSWFLALGPSLPWSFGKMTGVPVKDYIAQSAEFTISAFLLAPFALIAWREGRHGKAVGLLLLALAFLTNVVYVLPGRTELVVIPILLLLFAARWLSLKGAVALMAAGVVAGGLFLAFAPELRDNVVRAVREVRSFTPQGERTRAGERLEFWRKSIGFVADAPLIGHGTGSIHSQFRSVEGQTGMTALTTANPHNQTFAVAIQLGLVGTAVLFAMWLAHLLVFCGAGLAAWAGLAIVVQNVIGSLFNSHLFDFTHGWGYVIGVGVAAGVVLRQRREG